MSEEYKKGYIEGLKRAVSAMSTSCYIVGTLEWLQDEIE